MMWINIIFTFVWLCEKQKKIPLCLVLVFNEIPGITRASQPHKGNIEF